MIVWLKYANIHQNFIANSVTVVNVINHAFIINTFYKINQYFIINNSYKNQAFIINKIITIIKNKLS